MKTILKSAIVFLSFVCLLQMPAYAGDLMNIDFLQNQAQKNNPDFIQLQRKIQRFWVDSNGPDKMTTGLNIASTGLYSGTFYVHGPSEAWLGTVAGIETLTTILLEHYKHSRDLKEIRALLKSYTDISNRLNAQILQLYPAFKSGSADARSALARLTGEAALQEVEENISLERDWQARHPDLPKSAAKLPVTTPASTVFPGHLKSD